MTKQNLEIFKGQDVSAAAGLAFDEALALSFEDGKSCGAALRLYTYSDHCALVGRFQRLESEIDLSWAQSMGVEVNRRPTGGGAILMGQGQLGIAFASGNTDYDSPRQTLEKFSLAITTALASFNIQATLRGKNDLEVNGRKMVGLGIYRSPGGGVLCHASLLVSLDVELMLSVLRIPASKLGAHGIEAVSQRTTTLNHEVGELTDLTVLDEALAGAFANVYRLDAHAGTASHSLLVRAEELRVTKYTQDTWLFDGGRSTAAESWTDFRTAVGSVRLVLHTQGSVIKSALVTGDFNDTPSDLIALEENLRWCVIDEDILAERLNAQPGLGTLVEPRGLARAICESVERSEGLAGPRRIGSCYLPEEMVS